MGKRNATQEVDRRATLAAAEEAVRCALERMPTIHQRRPLLSASYRTAELRVLISLSARIIEFMQQLASVTADHLQDAPNLSLFDSHTAWEAFWQEHFGELLGDENKARFVRRWLAHIDRISSALDPKEHASES